MEVKHTASSLARLRAAQARKERTTSETPPRKPPLQPCRPSLKAASGPKTAINLAKAAPESKTTTSPAKASTRTYRIGRIPGIYNVVTLREALRVALNLATSSGLEIRSLSAGYLKDEKGVAFLVATLECKDILAHIKTDLSNLEEAKLQPSTRTDEWQVELCHPSLGDIAYVFLDSHFIGFTPLSPLGGTYVTDCVAIHGWGGHAFGAFKAHSQNFMWLRDRLPKDIPSLRVWIYGYDFGLQTEESFAGIDEHAENFRHLLGIMRRSTQTPNHTPLMFIAHSLGGIILKQAFIAMRESSNSREQMSIDCTTGITFFGVPSQGMKTYALAAMIGDRPQKYDLSRLDQDVGYRLRDKQHRDFCKAFDYRDAKVVQFFETKKTPDVQEDPITKKWTRTGTLNILVDIMSATSCGRDWENTNDFKISLNSDHIEMVKFGPNDLEGYPKVKMVLEDMAQDANQILATRSNASRDEQDAFLDSLSFPEMGGRAEHIIRPLANTCQWIWRDESHKFSEWLADTSHKAPVFVVEGKPGSGKSTLVKHILERRQQSAAQNLEFVVGFFFNEGGAHIEKTSDALFRTCLHQILTRYRAGFRSIINIYRKERRSAQELGTKRISWDTATLRTMFCDVVRAICQETDKTAFQRLLFIIDGLDECDSTFSRLKEAVNTLLQDIALSSCVVKICFSSRPNTRNAFLAEHPRLTLQTRNSEDIKTYVKKTAARALEQDPGFSVLMDEVILKADGIILWAELVLGELLKGKDDGNTVAELQEALRKIPTSLKNLFEGMLGRIESQYVPETKILLRTVLFARRPLTLEELRRVMAFGSERFLQLSDYHTSLRVAHDDLVYKQRLQSRGGGLLEVRAKGHWEGSVSTVQFIHQAAKDFVENDSEFLKPTLLQSTLSIGNQFLLQSCMRYLSLSDFSDALGDISNFTNSNDGSNILDIFELGETYPFLEYATLFWMDHWRAALESRDDGLSVVEEAGDFVNIGLKNWIRTHRAFSSEVPQHTADTTLSSIAAEMGICGFLVSALQGIFDVNHRSGRYGFLLQAAAAHGHEHFVQMLLENGAEINAYGGCYGTALIAAASSGHNNVTRCLLKHSAALNTDCGNGKTALKAAIESGHPKVIAALLEAGAYAAESDKDKKLILNARATKKDWSVVELLLSHGADANQMLPKPKNENKNEESEKSTGRLTLLHIAIDQNAPPAITRMLLDRGADPSLKDDLGQTPLRHALYRGHKDASKMLITTVQHVEDLTSDDEWNTMHCLSARGDTEIVDLAISLGPNLTKKTKEGWSPLHIAAEAKNFQALAKLLEQDCALNEPNGEGWTALHLAVDEGFKSGAQALLEKGADVDATTPKMWSALHLATYHGYRKIIAMLLEHKASVHLATAEGFTALLLAGQNLEQTKATPQKKKESSKYYRPVPIYRRPGYSPYYSTPGYYEPDDFYQNDGSLTITPYRSMHYSGNYTSGIAIDGSYMRSRYYNPSHSATTRTYMTDTAYQNTRYVSAGYYSTRTALSTLNSVGGANPNSRYRYSTQSPYSSTWSTYERSPEYGSTRRYSRYRSPPRYSVRASTPPQYEPTRVSSLESEIERPSMVEILLDAGANINDKTVEGWTILHFATKAGDIESVKLAIANKADVNAVTVDLWTPLHFAIHHRREKIATQLLKAESSLDSKTDKGLTPLILAVNAEDESLLDLFLHRRSRNMPAPHINEVAKSGYSALHLAAELLQTGMVYSLLREGADEQLLDGNSMTPLQMVPTGNDEVSFLLQPETASFVKTLRFEPNTISVLHIASSKGYLRVIELLLLQAKIDVNILDDRKRTPLHAAVDGRQIRAVRLLLKHSANVSASDVNNRQPLHLAATHGQEQIGSVLLRKDALVDAIDDEGITPLHEACKNGHVDIARILFEHGSKVDTVDSSGYTPLHWAVDQGHEEIVKYLLEKKVGLEVQDNSGQTALSMAVKRTYTSIVKLLLAEGASSSAMTEDDVVALHSITVLGDAEDPEVIFDAGSELDAKMEDGMISSQLSAENEDEDIWETLEHGDIRHASVERENVDEVMGEILQAREVQQTSVEQGNVVDEMQENFQVGEVQHTSVEQENVNEEMQETLQSREAQCASAEQEIVDEEMLDSFDSSSVVNETADRTQMIDDIMMNETDNNVSQEVVR